MNGTMVKLLGKYLRGFLKEAAIGPAFKLTEAIFELIVPLVMAQIIDVGVANGDKGYVLRMGGVMVLLGVVGLCCALVCQYFASRASQGVGTVMRNDMFRHISTLSHAEIDKIGTPSLITRITNDVNQLQTAVAMLIRLVIRAPFLVIGATVMAISIDWKMSGIFLTAMVLIALVLYLIMSRSIPFFKVVQRLLDKISLITRENLEGVRVIRAFSRQGTEKKRFAEACEEQSSTAIRVGKLSALLNPLTYIIVNLAIVAIIWFGGYRVDGGALTQGKLIALVNYMTQIMLAMVVVANLVVIFTRAAASAARVNEIFAVQSSIVPGEKEVLTVSGAPRVEWKDVSFGYGGSEEYALEHVKLQVQPGETIGVIGGTGSGKSTLVNLIPRFYDVSEGALLVDGVNVREYPFEQLRKQIGVVPQRAVLFTGTIRENMRWGEENASDEEIWKALDIAQASEFVKKLPEGLDYKILQGGKNLSGGQKQRLTIARALIDSPKILILDDSASALDFATDAALRRAIRKQTQNMTVFMVSQRANTVRNADKIVVLDDGGVAGIGTHDELFERCEVYREICLSQLSPEEVSR